VIGAVAKEARDHKAVVIVISGPSGVGKSTICREVIKRLGNVHLSVSATTRERGGAEADGQDYRFIAEEEFRRQIEQGMFLEHAEVFGNFYGTPLADVEEALAAGKSVILEIDIQGARQVKKVYPDALTIFILPPTPEQLAERITGRGRDADETAQKRLNLAQKEIAEAMGFYDYMVINKDLAEAVEEVAGIINKGIGDE